MEKGKFYHGAVGVGKTTKLKTEFQALEHKSKRWIKAREVALAAERHGLSGVASIAESVLHLFIDDLGHEAQTVNHFGTIFSPMTELIQAWYDQSQEWPQWKMTIHFTSNLSLGQLRELYGEYIFDRLIEMCVWTHAEGDSFRK